LPTKAITFYPGFSQNLKIMEIIKRIKIQPFYGLKFKTECTLSSRRRCGGASRSVIRKK
jgi:hypothetical protein